MFKSAHQMEGTRIKNVGSWALFGKWALKIPAIVRPYSVTLGILDLIKYILYSILLLIIMMRLQPGFITTLVRSNDNEHISTNEREWDHHDSITSIESFDSNHGNFIHRQNKRFRFGLQHHQARRHSRKHRRSGSIAVF